MILTILRILFLRLRNNPLELLLVFVMPVAFFSIFAAIFSNGITTGSEKKLRVGWIANRETAFGHELREFLEKNSLLECHSLPAKPTVSYSAYKHPDEVIDEMAVEALITEAQRSGLYDLILRLPPDFPSAFSEGDHAQLCHLKLVTDGQNPMAVAIVSSVVKAFFVQKKAAWMAEKLLDQLPSSQRSMGALGKEKNNWLTDSFLEVQSSTAPESGDTRWFDFSTDAIQVCARGTQFLGAAEYFTTIFQRNSVARWMNDDVQAVTSTKKVFDVMKGMLDSPLKPNRSNRSSRASELRYFQSIEDLSQIPARAVRYRDLENAAFIVFCRDWKEVGLFKKVGHVTSGDGELIGANERSVAWPNRTDSVVAKLIETSVDTRPAFDSADAVNISVENPQSEVQENPRIAMYAAGIAVLFLLFSSTGNAATLLEEAESGTLDRIMVGKATLFHIIGGKWLGIFLLGCVQISVMFLWAELIFRIQLWKHLGGFLVMTCCTAAATASLAMLMATLCRSRAQLNAISVVLILSMSAVGGSMIPRFAMSERMKEIGKWTFNAWALDGYQKVFWYQSPISSLFAEVTVLVGSAFVFGLLALFFSHRWKYG